MYFRMKLVNSIKKSNKFETKCLFSYSYHVFAHERGSRLQMVHEILVAELSAVLISVVHAIPRFETDEGGVLAVGRPYSHTRGVEIDGHHGAGILRVENLDGVNLTLVDDDGVVLECLLGEGHQSSLERGQRIAVGGDAAFVVAVDAVDRIGVVEAQHALHRLALGHAGQVEGWMSTYLEVNLTLVGVVNMPDDVHLVAHELVGDCQHEVVGILAQRVLVVVQQVGDALLRELEELKVHVARKTVAAKVVGVALGAVGALPQSAYYWEENWRTAAPILVVALPQIFLAIAILDALEFGSEA